MTVEQFEKCIFRMKHLRDGPTCLPDDLDLLSHKFLVFANKSSNFHVSKLVWNDIFGSLQIDVISRILHGSQTPLTVSQYQTGLI